MNYTSLYSMRKEALAEYTYKIERKLMEAEVRKEALAEYTYKIERKLMEAEVAADEAADDLRRFKVAVGWVMDEIEELFEDMERRGEVSHDMCCKLKRETCQIVDQLVPYEP